MGTYCYFLVDLIFHSQYSANAATFSALLHNVYVLWHFDSFVDPLHYTHGFYWATQ